MNSLWYRFFFHYCCYCTYYYSESSTFFLATSPCQTINSFQLVSILVHPCHPCHPFNCVYPNKQNKTKMNKKKTSLHKTIFCFACFIFLHAKQIKTVQFFYFLIFCFIPKVLLKGFLFFDHFFILFSFEGFLDMCCPLVTRCSVLSIRLIFQGQAC